MAKAAPATDAPAVDPGAIWTSIVPSAKWTATATATRPPTWTRTAMAVPTDGPPAAGAGTGGSEPDGGD